MVAYGISEIRRSSSVCECTYLISTICSFRNDMRKFREKKKCGKIYQCAQMQKPELHYFDRVFSIQI